MLFRLNISIISNILPPSLSSGGVQFADLSHNEAVKFQENLLKTMVQIEDTFFDLAATCQKNCLVICDRGVMDASACK